MINYLRNWRRRDVIGDAKEYSFIAIKKAGCFLAIFAVVVMVILEVLGILEILKWIFQSLF